MTIWISIIIAGIINYLSRLGSILLINPKNMSQQTKAVLNYVPSAVFPAIIFPAVFLDNQNNFVELNDPKLIAFSIAFLIGFLFKNLILTILVGLITFWIIIFAL